MTRCNRMGKIEYDLPETKFISLIKFVVAFKKVFRLYLRFPDFFQVWKIAGQISRFYGPCKCGMHYTTHFCAWPHSSNTVLKGFGALIYSLFKGRLEFNVISAYVYKKSTCNLRLNIPLISKKLVILDKILIKNSTATTLQINTIVSQCLYKILLARAKGSWKAISYPSRICYLISIPSLSITLKAKWIPKCIIRILT